MKKVLAAVFWPFDRSLALLAFVAVWVYRKVISPRKGFRCATGATDGTPSCSEAAQEAFRTRTFSVAIPLIRAQFARCRQSFARYRADLLSDADKHLSRVAALGAATALGCCDGCGGGGGGGGPLGRNSEEPRPQQVVRTEVAQRPAAEQPPPPADAAG